MASISHWSLFNMIGLVFFIFIMNSGRFGEAKANNRLILEYNWPHEIKGLKRFPHQVSCRHFFVTRPDGRHDLKKCSGGKRFDFPTLKCTDKKAKCWSEWMKQKFPKKPKKNMECPFSWGFYPDINDCSSFFSCFNRAPYHRKCPPTTLFDKALRQCTKGSEAMCADSSDIVEPGFECPYNWGRFSHLQDCSKFHECLERRPSVRSCKRNMLFDNMKRKCLPKDNVDCGQRYNSYDFESISTKVVMDSSKMPFIQIATDLSSKVRKTYNPAITESVQAEENTQRSTDLSANLSDKTEDVSTKEVVINTEIEENSTPSKVDSPTKTVYYRPVTGESSTVYVPEMQSKKPSHKEVENSINIEKE